MAVTVLLTGGAGYIGSHTCIALAEAGYRPVILDDFSNSRPSVIQRLERITGQKIPCERLDILDIDELATVFIRHRIGAVVHFAALKSVGDSVVRPLDYFQTNIAGLVGLTRVMQEAGVFTLVFSSSATVYGDPDRLPVPESAPRRFASPYAYSKLVCEQILEQLQGADPRWRIGVLRYFNPVGAHPSGLIGEDPVQQPNNLMPLLGKVAIGKLPEILVFGDDYQTPDGTGVRDYIHVSDLAAGHVLSLSSLIGTGKGHVTNLGTGHGYSVLEVIEAYSDACGRALPYSVVARRDGDVGAYYCDPGRAATLLGFKARHGLEEMCRSSWRWIRSGISG